MKKLAIVVVCLATTIVGYAQGTFNFANKVTSAAINAPIFDAGGTLLAGDGYLAQLWAGPNAGGLVAVGDAVPFRTGAAAGYISGVGRTLPTAAWATPGATVVLQFRAWAKSAGATWELASASGANFGQLATPLSLASGGVGDPPGLPADLKGLTSFNLVPEPSIIALGVLGAAALVLRRRK